jgi:hypothetical protein
MFGCCKDRNEEKYSPLTDPALELSEVLCGNRNSSWRAAHSEGDTEAWYASTQVSEIRIC